MSYKHENSFSGQEMSEPYVLQLTKDQAAEVRAFVEDRKWSVAVDTLDNFSRKCEVAEDYIEVRQPPPVAPKPTTAGVSNGHPNKDGEYAKQKHLRVMTLTKMCM